MADSLFDRYAIQRVLNSSPGGRAYSWKGERIGDGQPAVIKALANPLPADRLQHWDAVSSPFVQCPTSVEEDEDGRYLVRPWVDGVAMTEAMQFRAHLPSEAAARTLFAQLALGLEAIHRVGETHRSIKASNVIIQDNGGILVDPNHRGGGPAPGSGLPGAVESALAYSNPEFLRREPEVPSSDVYSLAALMYHWMTGVHVFPGDYPQLVAAQHLYTRPVFIGPSGPTVTGGLAAVLQRALAKKTTDRFATAAEFADALADGVDTDAPDILGELKIRGDEDTGEESVWQPNLYATYLVGERDFDLLATLDGTANGMTIDELRSELLEHLGDPAEKKRIPIVRAKVAPGDAPMKTYEPPPGAPPPTPYVPPDLTQEPPAVPKPRPDITPPGDDRDDDTQEVSIHAPGIAPPPPSPHGGDDMFKVPFFIVLAWAVAVTVWLVIEILRN